MEYLFATELKHFIVQLLLSRSIPLPKLWKRKEFYLFIDVLWTKLPDAPSQLIIVSFFLLLLRAIRFMFFSLSLSLGPMPLFYQLFLFAFRFEFFLVFQRTLLIIMDFFDDVFHLLFRLISFPLSWLYFVEQNHVFLMLSYVVTLLPFSYPLNAWIFPESFIVKFYFIAQFLCFYFPESDTFSKP